MIICFSFLIKDCFISKTLINYLRQHIKQNGVLLIRQENVKKPYNTLDAKFDPMSTSIATTDGLPNRVTTNMKINFLIIAFRACRISFIISMPVTTARYVRKST